MTYSTPDLDTISLDTNATMRSTMQREPTLPRSMLGVIAKALSGAVDGLYERIDGVAKDIIYTTARKPALIRSAGIWGKTLKAPSPASAIVEFTGGIATLAEGAILARADGIQYQLQLDVTLIDGTGLGEVVCLSGGAMTTLTDGTVLTLTQPVAGISTEAVVQAYDLTPGADIETPAELLVRLLERIRETPQGGAAADYKNWALSVAGVTRAWTVPGWNGAGTVGVLFMCDDRDDPVPLGGDVIAVQAAIDAERPVAAISYAVAPTAAPLDFTITLMPTSAALEAAVQAQLANLIATEAEPTGYTLPLTHIWAAVQAAIGNGTFTMTSPLADVVTPAGTITTMGAITW